MWRNILIVAAVIVLILLCLILLFRFLIPSSNPPPTEQPPEPPLETVTSTSMPGPSATPTSTSTPVVPVTATFTPVPGPTATPTVPPVPPTAVPVQHVVKQGEWLLQIARCYGTSPESIVYANHIPYPSWIMVGEVFVIPRVGDVSAPFNDGECIMWYTVKAGDTLPSIAAAYQVDLDRLVKANYGCFGYHSNYPGGGYYGYGYGYHSPYIYSGCYYSGVPNVYVGQQLVIPVNNANKHLRP